MRSRSTGAILVAALTIASPALADGGSLSADDILGRPEPFRIESARVRFSYFTQDGLGWQSKAGPPRSPGSEELTVEQAQLEVVAKQGERLTHRLWIPLDIITSASAAAIDQPGRTSLDVLSGASKINESGSIDYHGTYQYDRDTTLSLRAGFHLEEPFRSWNVGLGATRQLAEGNATIGVSVNQIWDWFDAFYGNGDRLGHATRSSTNANLSYTQLLSPTTVAHLNYGLTVQIGELSNTWNSLPPAVGERVPDLLPGVRHRHAFVGRLAQFLPWQGALKAFYRFYVDSWGLVAHTVELELAQRVTSWFYLRGNYRYHHQSAVDFWTTLMPRDAAAFRTGDSDLAEFDAHTVGMKASFDVRGLRRVRELHVDLGYERYVRSNDLHASIATCGLGLRFY